MMKNIHLPILIILTTLLCSCEQNTGAFSLVNNSTTTITTVLIKVCDQNIEFENVQVGEVVRGSYEVKSDSHFDVSVKFRGERRLHAEIGYVTNGLDFQHEIMITDHSIKLAGGSI